MGRSQQQTNTNKNQDQGAKKDKPQESFGRYDFVKLAPLMGGISLFLVLASLALIFFKGLNYGIDFAGGTEVQVKFEKPVDAGQVRTFMEQMGFKNPAVQSFGGGTEFLIRTETIKGASDKETNQKLQESITRMKTGLKEQFGLGEEGVRRVDTVGPQVGAELKRNGVLAAFYSLLVILIYVALRFDYKYAPGAVVCLFHDAIITLGVFALLGREVNVQIMAAVLTLIGYSLNDTIVTFDRIREVIGGNRDLSLSFVINRGVNETLGRTILTATATMLAVLALYVFGGGVISDLAFALLIGIIVGAYSTIYVAAPLILVMDKFTKKPKEA